MKSLFILSAHAGVGRPLEYREMLEQTWKDAGKDDDMILSVTLKAGDTAEYARKFADEYGADGIVYILGGDGSFSEVAGALVNSETAVGFIPAGTANDLARALYGPVPKQIEQRKAYIRAIIEKTVAPQMRTMDVVEFTSDDLEYPHAYAVNILSFGMDSKILADAMANLRVVPRATGLAYNLAVLTNMLRLKSYHVTCELELEQDGVAASQRFEQEITLTAICNGGYYGGGFNPSPHPNMHDGYVDVLLTGTASRARFAKLATKLKEGTHLGNPEFTFVNNVVAGKVTYQPTASIPRMPANFDGTLFSFTELEFKVLKGALKVADLS